MKKTYKIINRIILSIAVAIVFTSCYTVHSTNYVKEENYAVFSIKSTDITDDFTDYKEGLKITYDFWGDNLIIVLENISDKTIFIDLNNSLVSSGKEKTVYNSMVAGTFDILPLESGNKIELDDFIIFNTDNEEKIKEKIKIAKTFTSKALSFKTGDYPINITNTVKFGYVKTKSNEFIIEDKFYSEKVKILNISDFEHLNQYGKLYNKTFYQTSTTKVEETQRLETLIEPEDMINIFISVLYLALAIYQ